MGICPDLQFKGFGGALYAGAYAEYRFLEYEKEVVADIYWDFSGSRTPQAHILSLTDISDGDPSQTWRPVGKRLLKWGETNRLVTQDISGRYPLSGVEPLDVQEEVEASPELCIVENVIGLAGPKVRADDSDADILFVMHDTDKPWYGATDIGRVFWDENTDPQLELVTDDLLAEFSPEFVKFDDNSLLAAWTRVEGDVSGVESPEDISPHVEIVSSFFDRASNTWSAPLRLTTNSQLDRDPLPVLFGETTGILWVQNEGTAMIGDEASGDSLLFSTWTGSGWSEPTTLWSAPKGILEFAFGSDSGGQGHVVFSVDEDGDTETLGDRELYSISTDNGAWQSVVRLTNNDVEDSLPVLVAPEGNLMLVWKSGERMLYTSLSGWNPADVYPEYTAAQNSPTLAGVTLTGGAAVAYSVQHEDGVDIVAAFYDAALDLWSLPRQLTHDEHAESFLSMAFDGKEMVLAYLKTQTLREDIEVELNGETRVIENAPRPGRTDLYILRHELGSGLSVKQDSLTVEPKNPAPGSQAAVRAVLVNEGDIPLEGVEVRLYSGNPSEGGEMIAETVIPGPLTAGASEDVAFTWDVPEDPNAHILYVVADPDMAVEDPDRSDNTESIWTVLPDIAVESTWSEQLSGTERNLTARVTNQGVIPTGAFDLSWRLGSQDGQEIGRSPVSGLEPSAAHDVSFVWDYSAGGNGDSTAVIYAVADPDDVVFELDTSNNSFFHATEVYTSGSLVVNLEVPEALTGEAGWRRAGTEEWLESGYAEVLDPGDYTVEFKPIPGWNTPENRIVTVSPGATTEVAGLYNADFAGGDGTEGNPYQVASANQLNNIRYHLGYPGRYFTLSNDIDLNTSPWNEGSGWEPIGTHEAPFTGEFNGNGHLISNLFINRPDMDNVGLFGVLDEGPRISNVGLTDVYVAGNNDVGGLVGCSLSVVDRAYVSGQVYGSENGENIGGLVGINAGSVTESYSTVNVSGFTNVGGLVGLTDGGVIDDCYSTGFVNGSDAIGGLVGRANGGYIRWSYATGLVELNQEGGNQGGLVGISEYDATITDSYWDMETSLQSQSAGGTGLSTAQMRESASYTGWEFSEGNAWNRADALNGGYPYLTSSTLHTISVSVTPENSGSVEWAGMYPQGTTARLIINPEAGYTTVSVSGCDGSLEGDVYTISPVTQPCYVTVQFSIDQYILAGDVNDDDKIDLADAILALQVISGISVSNKVHKGADIDGDNRIGFAEAVYILQELSKGETQQEGFLRSPASYDSDPVYMASDMEAMIDGFSEFTLDFVNNWEGSRNTINQWVEDQTNDKIKDLLPQGSITPDTAVVLTNAIYFKRSWYKKFEEELTAPGPFYRLDGTTVTSDMMHGRLDTRYARGVGFDAVELPS
ncbi:MAG TPA: hypothetical protein ENN79_09415 [Desulfobacteraceae bacterium]|nr:hypothetical protein [Desulfobacteraceae bacterium]